MRYACSKVWTMRCRRLATRVLFLLCCVVSHVGASGDSVSSILDGYAFQCSGGSWSLAFGAQQSVFCGSGLEYALPQDEPCGTYTFSPDDSSLQLFLGDSIAVTFGVINVVDGILLSFQTTQRDIGCHAVSTDWPNYNRGNYFLGVTCSSITQNNNSPVHRMDHFSLGLSGDVAWRSSLDVRHAVVPNTNTLRGQQHRLAAASPTSTTIVTDLYGIARYNQDTETVRMYFGPQHDQHPTTIIFDAAVTLTGELVYSTDRHKLLVTPLTCNHDGESLIKNVHLWKRHLAMSAERLPTTKETPATRTISAVTKSGPAESVLGTCITSLLVVFLSTYC